MTFFLSDAFFGFQKGDIFRAHDFEHAFLALIAVAVFIYMDRAKGRKSRGPIGYSLVWIQYFFGIHALMSGLVYFLSPAVQPVMADPDAAQFQLAIQSIGLFTIVKVIEVIVGACLILNRFVPLAAIFEMPISAMIFYMSVFVDMDARTVWTGPKELIANAAILLAYWGYFRPIFSAKLAWSPLWDKNEIAKKLKVTNNH